MLIDELHAQRDLINPLGQHYGARRIRVFGSVARRTGRKRCGLSGGLFLRLSRPTEVLH
jgi:predicted nucleotidyltransferase